MSHGFGYPTLQWLLHDPSTFYSRLDSLVSASYGFHWLNKSYFSTTKQIFIWLCGVYGFVCGARRESERKCGYLKKSCSRSRQCRAAARRPYHDSITSRHDSIAGTARISFIYEQFGLTIINLLQSFTLDCAHSFIVYSLFATLHCICHDCCLRIVFCLWLAHRVDGWDGWWCDRST